MLDSLVRKFSKLNKNQTNTHQNPHTNHLAFCSSSSFTSSISSSSSSYSSSSTPNTPFDLSRNCVMLELYDLHESNIKPDAYHINNPIPEQVEHIYEEIEENNNHIMSHHKHKTSNKIVMLREELINEILPSNTSSLFSNKSSSSSGSSSTSSSFSSKKKKSVRFNSTSGQEVLNGKLTAKESSQITSNVIPNDSILCSECVNCLKHQPIMHHNQHSFNSILKKPLNDESTSSSSSFYTTNSINSTSSIITSTHSHTFNQLIEDFLNQATKSPSKCNKNNNNTLPSNFKQNNHFQNEPSVTLGFDQCKKGSSSSSKSFVYFKNNSENNGPKNASQTKSVFELNKLFNTPTLSPISQDSSNASTSIDDRLSFRVTNLTMQDLKNRQKLIELKKSCSMNIFF
jgi:hypothetical protein